MKQKIGKRKQKENKEEEREREEKILVKTQDNKPSHLNYLINLFPKGGSSFYP